MVEAALCACVIGLTDGEEIRCQAARHHLPSVHKDVCRKQAKREHACGGKMPAHSFSLAAINQDLTNTAKQIRDSWKHICRSTIFFFFFPKPSLDFLVSIVTRFWILQFPISCHCPTDQIYTSNQCKQDCQQNYSLPFTLFFDLVIYDII